MVKKKSVNKGLAFLGIGIGAAVLLGFKGRGGLTVGVPTGGVSGDVADALNLVKELYGRNFAEQIEQALRWETAHFKSEQWEQGNTAGMEATTNSWPYGWQSLEDFIKAFPELNLTRYDFMTYQMVENNTGDVVKFIRFPSAYDFILFFAWFIQTRRNGRVGNWYSLDNEAAARYENKIAGVNPSIVNSL